MLDCQTSSVRQAVPRERRPVVAALRAALGEVGRQRGVRGLQGQKIAHQKSRPQHSSWIFSGILRWIVSGMSQWDFTFRRAVTFPVDVHWNVPIYVQWHSPMESHFCDFQCVILLPRALGVSTKGWAWPVSRFEGRSPGRP